MQEQGSSKVSVRSILRSLSPFTRTRRSDPEGTATGHVRPRSQSDTVINDPLVPASGGILRVSETAILASNPPDIVITAIAPANPSSQTLDPVSTPASYPSTFSHLWQKALEIAQESLAKYGLPPFELGSLQSQSAADNSIQSLVAELQTAHQENKDKQWRYKDRHGNEVVLVERLGKILKSVNKYATIVDTAIQHHPDITSLVWAGARAILQVCNGLSEANFASSLIFDRLH